MQKVIFMSIDVLELAAKTHETFSFSSCGELNELLEEGWELDEWSFLLDDPIDNKVPIMVVLLKDPLSDEVDEQWGEWEDEIEEEDDSLQSEADPISLVD